MDTTQVHMVRSSRDKDMLCVGGFLYHYRDYSDDEFQWICSKRKDKVFPCRSRILTTLIANDITKHRIMSVFGEHTHQRCTEEEVEKAFERKRIADFEGKTCSLLTLRLQQKLRRIEEIENARRYSDSDVSDPDSRTDFEPIVDGNTPSERQDQEMIADDSKLEEQLEITDNLDEFLSKYNMKKNKPYLLKNPQERQFLCMDGYLYRLISWSKKTFVYTWKCARRCDESCPATLTTTRKPDGQHRVKECNMSHIHEIYGQEKLLKVIRKYELSLVPKLHVSLNDENMNSSCGEFLQIGSDLPVKKRTYLQMTNTINYKYESNPVNILHADELGPNGKRVLKFTFLPSAKGKNKVLCLDNYLYHFKQQAARKAGHVYWTCMLRRHKALKCNATVTTKTVAATPTIVRVSGEHTHSFNLDDIKRRVLQDAVLKRAKKTNTESKQLLKEALDELGDEFRSVVDKSKDSIDRRVARVRGDGKKKITRTEEKLRQHHGDSDESSVFSGIDSDDYNFDMSELPTNIEEMRKCVVEPVKVLSTRLELDPCDYEDEMPVDEEFLRKRCSNESNEEDALAGELTACHGAKETVFRCGRKRVVDGHEVVPDMDITQILLLHSAKGGQLLCVDDFVYHIKEQKVFRTYWTCVKRKHPEFNCRSAICTTLTKDGTIRILSVTNHHSHPSDHYEVQKRMFKDKDFCKGEQKFPSIQAAIKKSKRIASRLARKQNHEKDEVDVSAMEPLAEIVQPQMPPQMIQLIKSMKLYAVSDGPPSLAVRMTLKALEIQHELINVDYMAGDHMTEQYAEMNPQKEIPVLDDDGFYLSESIAICQYLCDKYAPGCDYYPQDATKRAIVNQRLCFNMGFYYSSISAHAMAPIFFDYQRTDMSLKKVKNALNVFETYLKRGGTKYAAADHVTIADFALISATLCLEAINFDLSAYPLVAKWYETFKEEQPKLWKIGKKGMKEIADFEQNPPDLSHMDHPFHPTRKPSAAKKTN